MLLKPDKEVYNIENFTGWKYDNPDFRSKVVGASVLNRYPKRGYTVNEECDTHLLIWQGHATVGIDDILYRVTPGDVIYIRPGSKYFINQDSFDEVKLWMICYPEFNIDNHKVVE